VPGEVVQLAGGNQWRLRSSNPATTNSAGRATFELTCKSTGPPGLVVQLSDGRVYDLKLPDCIDASSLTTTTTEGSTTTVPKSSTSSTTSTSQP
jgi:hypothetical protein